MTYQTRLWHFYWERLGYESNTLPTQCKPVERVSEGNQSTKHKGTGEVKPTSRGEIQSSVG
jgi:hypothetical protein